MNGKFKKNYRIIGLVLIVILIIGVIFYFESMKVSPSAVLEDKIEDEIEIELKDGIYPKAPELVGISGYLNTNGEEIKISDYEGKVVLIDFWTYTCINCIRTFPFLTGWDSKYMDEGLVIIGVHTPEFEFEKIKENVQKAMDDNGIKYAVVQDNDYGTWRAFENRYWPRKYLIDSEGFIRYDHIGEGGYEETEKMIQELLGEIGEDVSDVEIEEEPVDIRFSTTPELYAGYNFALSRGQNIGNEGGLKPDETIEYTIPTDIIPNVIYLNGIWKSNSDGLELVSDTGSVVLAFQAKEVNIVADNLNEIVTMGVLINGEYVNEEFKGKDVKINEDGSFVIINEPKLYNVFEGSYGNYVLELGVSKGFSFNAFTFGG